MSSGVNTYLESPGVPVSEAIRRLEGGVGESTGVERLRLTQHLRVARALSKLEISKMKEEILCEALGLERQGGRQIDQMGLFYLDFLRKGLSLEPFFKKLHWFDDPEIEFTKSMLRGDPDLSQSEYYEDILRKYDESVGVFRYNEKMHRLRVKQSEDKGGREVVAPNRLSRNEQIKQQFDPRRVNHTNLLMAGVLDVFGYGHFSMDNPILESLVERYGEKIVEVIDDWHSLTEENKWVPSKHYLKAKEYLGPQQFAQLQERIADLNAVLSRKRVSGKLGMGEVSKLTPQELKMIYASAKLAAIFIGEEFYHPEVVKKLSQIVTMDYDFAGQPLGEVRERYFMGPDLYDALQRGEIPELVPEVLG